MTTDVDLGGFSPRTLLAPALELHRRATWEVPEAISKVLPVDERHVVVLVDGSSQLMSYDIETASAVSVSPSLVENDIIQDVIEDLRG